MTVLDTVPLLAFAVMNNTVEAAASTMGLTWTMYEIPLGA